MLLENWIDIYRHQHGISIETMLKVYNTCVASSLLYACEAWVIYLGYMKRQYLRQKYLSNLDILERSLPVLGLFYCCAGCDEVFMRLWWRMIASLAVSVQWISWRKRLAHKLKLKYKDCIRNTLKKAKWLGKPRSRSFILKESSAQCYNKFWTESSCAWIRDSFLLISLKKFS